MTFAMFFNTPLIVVGLALSMLTLSARAERAPKIQVLDAKILGNQQETEHQQKVSLARKLIRDKNYEAASALLETLTEQEEVSPVVVNLLLSCYDHLGYYVKSEAIVQRLVDRNPQNYTNRLRLAEVFVKQGQLDEAESEYGKVVAMVRSDDVARYRTILNSMINHGLENLALNLIDTVRQVLSDSTTLAFERGVILEKQNSYQQAVLEFFVVLGDSGKAAIKAEKRLLALLHYPESSADAEQTLLAQTERDINARAVKILSSHYLKEEQFAQAFDFAVLRDSLEDGTGASLMEFMRGCMERKLYQQASRMAQYILSRYDNAPFTGGTYFLYAEALVQLGLFDKSIAVYDTIIATFPRHQDKAAALYRIGDIYLNRLNDPARALAVFDSVITYYDAGVGYLFAKLGIPYCHLRQGRLDQARADFEDILQLRLNEDMKEQVEHNLALILFFEKKHDSSRVALRKLLVDYPRGFFVNDAVQLLLLLDEAEGASQLLNEFSNALLFEQRRMLDSTAAKLLVIAHDPNRALADVALFKLAVLSLDRSDSVSALEYIDQLATDFPESYYLPFGLKTKADVYLTKPEQIEEAKSIYRHLLESFPNYPFVSDVRKKMRQLEGEA